MSMSQFHTETARVPGTLTLTNGTSVTGAFFVASASPTHPGPMRVKDLLNLERAFFPFEVVEAAGTRTHLFNRAHVVSVTLATDGEPRVEAGYDVAPSRRVALRLSAGPDVHGAIRIYQRPGHERTSDYARDRITEETFRYLERESDTLIVNMAHVLQISEID
jgi:hypothetical protein